jgi:hypothetical protein
MVFEQPLEGGLGVEGNVYLFVGQLNTRLAEGDIGD